MGVSPQTYMGWESNRFAPLMKHWPGIIAFLGYEPNPPPSSLGEKITARRRALGLSCKRAARMLGVNEHALTKWERDETRPTGKSYEAVTKFLSPR